MSERLDAFVERRFWWLLGGALVLGVGVRLAYVAATSVPSEPGFLVNFDPIYYHRQALAVADGQGFIAPYRADGAPSADHPPLLVALLAVASKLGVDGWGAHRAITAVVGAGIVPLLGILGRRLGGARAGIVAAVLGAVLPSLWGNDGLLMPEPLYAVAVVGVLVLAHQVWDGDPPVHLWVASAGMGALIALSGLARGEGLLLAAFTVAPLALWAPGLVGWRQRVAVVAVAGVACVAVLAPWLAYNARRFEEPILLSSSADSAMAGANCDLVWSGPQIGSWNTDCFSSIASNQDLEESVYSGILRDSWTAYVRDNLGDLPLVASARAGRIWGVFKPAETVEIDELQNHPRPVGWGSLVGVWVLVPLAVAGGLRLRRAGRPVVLLVAMPVMVTVVAAAFYGNPRFRSPADLALVVLAAVALSSWRGPGGSPDGDREDAPARAGERSELRREGGPVTDTSSDEP